MASSSSTISKYDVFLNFRGIDTRDGFTSYLYEALRLAEINTFIDKKLERGEEITAALLQEIESSNISVVIFSQNYAFSPYCLDELVKIIECKESIGQVVFPVFYKVDPRDIEELRGNYEKAFAEHEAKFKEEKDKLEKWKSALHKAINLSGWHINDDKVEPKYIKKIAKTIRKKLNEEKKGNHERNEALPTKSLEGRNFQNKIDLILEWLSSNEVSSIGIYGMGGVGKTALVTHIHNKLLENPANFAHVYWVTVSQDFNVHKLQSLIAKTLKINLDTEEDERKRAATLSKELNERHKFVLILDDVWNHFDVTEVGIPIESNGCKLIVTTRSIEVCRRTNCQKITKVEPLNEEEAWDLFVKTFGCELSPTVEKIAKHIVRRCAGLPLAIITMAGSMKGVYDRREWKNALIELRRSIPRQQDMGDGVFRILRYSYTRLNDPTLQQCLLYCALFPEDYLITREQLIEYLIVEGIIDQEGSTRQENFIKGHTMLKKLVRVSLLEQVDGRVKMHGLIRDMAIQIMKECLPSIVEPAKRLQLVPDEKYWIKDIVRVSLMMNHIHEIPSNFSPSCPSLTTLLLFENWRLRSIPDCFFDQLKGLKVLDISRTNIEEMPESFSSLKSLTALFAGESFLSYIPTVANLKSMELLDLYECYEIMEVPIGLELLSNLKYLNLLFSGIRKFPAGILPRLPLLQFLAFDKACKNVEEFRGLQRLETLYWCFPSIRDLNTFQWLLPIEKIRYYLCVGRRLSHIDLKDDAAGHEMIIEGWNMTRQLWELDFLIYTLSLVRVSLLYGRGLCLQNPIGLKSLRIEGCDGIKYLLGVRTSPSILQSLESLFVYNMHDLDVLFFGWEMMVPRACYSAFSFGLKALHIGNCSIRELLPHSLLSNLQNLETIEVRDCEELEVIISVEEDWHTIPPSLPDLRELILVNLPQLKSICSEEIECDDLEIVRICNCEELKKIPISCPLLFLRSVKLSPRYWRETVEWDELDLADNWSSDSEGDW